MKDVSYYLEQTKTLDQINHVLLPYDIVIARG